MISTPFKVKMNSNASVLRPSAYIPHAKHPKMLKFVCVLSLISYSSSINPESALSREVFNYHQATSLKANFAREVVDKIYNSFRQWYFTITFCDFTYFENRILKYTENYGDGYPVLLLNGCPDRNTTKVKPRYNIHGQTAYVVTSEVLHIDTSEFVIDALKRTGVFQPRSAVIFVINVPIKMDSYFFYNIKNHFQLLWSRSVTNSVLVVQSGKLRIYSYNPYLDQLKDITNVKDVSQYLLQQYKNLYGHELRLSVFRKVYTTDETGPILCNSRLATTVMEYLNATCKPLVPRDGNTVGDLLDNGTATGVTADLMDGYTDFELSSRILKNSYYGYIETTYPLSQDELCFMIKKSDKQSAFTTTLYLISTKILFSFIFNFIFFIIIAIIVRKYESKISEMKDNKSVGSTVLDLIKCFLRQTVDIKFLGFAFRSVALIIIIYSLVINCAIDGIITSAITYPRYKPDINSMTDLMKTNLTLGIHNRDFKLFNSSLSDELKILLKDRIQLFSDQRIKEFIDKRQWEYATLLRKTDAQYISRRPINMINGRPLFHVVTDCPVPCPIVYGLRYGSPYLARLNYILHHLNQAGIIQHWTDTEEFTLYRKLFIPENKERKPLNLTNLQEIFIVHLIGMIISLMVFFIEILVHIFFKHKVITL